MIIVKQHDLTDCGPACLSSIVRYYGGYVPIEIIRLDASTDKNGTTASNLLNAARKYGLATKALKLNNFNEINNIDELPCVVHLKLKNGLFHFAVLYKVTKGHVILMDPAKGKTKLSIDEFKKIFDNIVFIFYPENVIKTFDKPISSLKFMSIIIKKNKTLMLKIIAYSIIVIILSIFCSYYIKLLDKINTHNNVNNLVFISTIFVLIYFIKNIIDYLKSNYLINLTSNINKDLYCSFIKKLFILPLNFIKSRTNGEIISRFNELAEITSIFPSIITLIFLDLITCIFALIISSIVSFKLTLVMILFILFYILIGLLFKNPTLQKIHNNIDISSEFNTKIIDGVNSIASVKFLNNENNIENRIKRASYNYIYDNEKLNIFLNKTMLIKQLIYDMSMFGISFYGMYLNYTGKISIVSLFTFIIVVNSFLEPIKELVDMIPKLCFIKSSIYKLNEFSIIKDDKNGIYNFKNGPIKIKNLSFAYNKIDNVFSNFSCNINENEKVLINGLSGCGKSTLSYILSKQLKYDKGSILINNVELNDIKDNDYRKNVTYVGQKDSLLVDTIINNIKCERTVSDKELITICKICEIDKIIDKKYNRFESILDESSANISGGEKQRIILARGLVQSGNIIILDEALSEVNIDMEERIIRRIFKHFKEKTIIYISHKKYNKLFDNVIYMN
jgi:ATP-binding cassette subfamily B protein